MAPSQDIVTRVSKYLPKDRIATVADLRRMHSADPDALFALAVLGLGDRAPIAAKGFEWLARTLSVLMRDGFSVATGAQTHYAKGNRGGFLVLDGGQDDIRFIQDLRTGGGYDSKLKSQQRSKECLDFFLEEFPWDDTVRKSMLLRVAPDDAAAIVGGLPRYQREALVDCAREVVRSPAAVYKGLRHDGPMQGEGWALCGIPTRRRMNDGSIQDPPSSFTFIVFVDPNGFVFDWDWVPSSADNPMIPRDADERFAGPPLSGVHADLLVGNVTRDAETFRPGAWFSAKGDCVFWYIDDAESYAAREDEFLTAFYRLGNQPRRAVGFKLKMVSRFRETFDKYGAPGEGILVQPSTAGPVQIKLIFLMDAWMRASLPRTQGLFDGMRLMEKLLTIRTNLDAAFKELEHNSPMLDIPKSLIHEPQEA